MQILIRQILIRLLLVLCFAFLPLADMAEAQNAEPAPKVTIDKRKLLVPPKNPDGSIIETPFSEDPLGWMRDKQQNFYGRMSGAIRGLKSSSPMAAAWTLIMLSFLYGVFHAAGPGHGKAVISAWLLATENDLRRGIVIAFLSALFQALTAIAIISALLLFVRSASGMARDVAGFLESASYLMIAGMGLYLIWTTFRPHGTHRHDQQKEAAPQQAAHHFEIVNPRSGHHPHHLHDENCGCGHVHAPGPGELKGEWSLRRAAALAFAVGLRPCTGALLVLIFSWGLGLYWAGVASTLAMAAGVFLTVAIIATLSVYAKALALRFAGLDNQKMAVAARALRLVGGIAILGLGGLMFAASLGSVNSMI